MNRKLQVFFDGHAPNWDEMISPDCTERLGEMMAELDIAEGATVLDVGAGTGVLTDILAPRVGNAGCIAAFDLSAEMLRKAKSKRPAAWCLQADALALPFAAQSFDWVICYSVFPHFSDQLEALRALAGVLRPKGRLVVCHSRSRQAINEHHESVGDVVGGHCIPEDEEMKALIGEAGFQLQRFDSRADRYIVIATL